MGTWIGWAVGLGVYNWFAVISTSWSFRKDPRSFGTPYVPLLAFILLAKGIATNWPPSEWSVKYLAMVAFVLVTEGLLSIPAVISIVSEAVENSRAIHVFPADSKSKNHCDFNKIDIAEISMVGDFTLKSENGKTWFELSNYRDRPTVRFPLVWKEPQPSSISKVVVRFSGKSDWKGLDLVEVLPEEILEVKVWRKEEKPTCR